MAKIHAQSSPCVYGISGSMSANGASSGSVICLGYPEIYGIWYSDEDMGACGIQVEQSSDSASNWDLVTACTFPAESSSTAACGRFPLYGDAVRVTVTADDPAPSTLRVKFWLRPIAIS